MAKYIGIILTIEFKTIAKDGSLLAIEPTSQEKLLDAIFGEKYLLVELVSKVGVVEANTLKALNEKTWAFAEQNNIADPFLFIKK